jgi:Fe-S-cluster-containing dehydrogenase component
MKKCTLCIDRIYNEAMEEVARVPACVSTCPATARHFGDLGDPDSDVSKMVAARGGVELMPEMRTKPVNRYLPPRPRREGGEASGVSGGPAALEDASPEGGFLGWLDKLLSD